MTRRPISIDLFAGAGGMSLGFEQAGFDVVAAVEIDPIHAATHEYNFQQTVVIPKSIQGLSGSEIRELAGIGNDEVDVVFGGAPCQGFSMIGQRALDDPRNELVNEFLRIVMELNAKYFVFENVKGLTVGKQKKFLDEIVSASDDMGYNVRLPYRVLNALFYSVPQDRQRLFLYGARKELALPEYPEAVSKRIDQKDMDNSVDFVPSCSQAIGDVPDAETFEELWSDDSVRVGSWTPKSVFAQRMRCLTNDAWDYGHIRNWDPNVLTASARTDHTDISRRRFGETPGGKVEPISRLYKLSADGVSNTLRAGTDGSRGAFTSPRPIHYHYRRCVTVREMARLHGFPDWFRFHWTKWHGARQIGNAVPPPLARHVAMSVMRALQATPSRSARKFSLGDEKLVRMDVSQAAAYFGIDNPIGRRNLKSGLRKRKQWQIEAGFEKIRSDVD